MYYRMHTQNDNHAILSIDLSSTVPWHCPLAFKIYKIDKKQKKNRSVQIFMTDPML